jgi:alkylation response protein AidB-like acyl-CoA dehydrogenase
VPELGTLGSIGISDEHVELHRVVRRWVGTHVSAKETKALLDEPVGPVGLPAFWDDLVAQGWLGLHVDERWGGAGYGLSELAVVLEELGRACAPGPFLPAVVAAAVVQALGSDDLRARLLPTLASGDRIVGIGLGTPLGVERHRLFGTTTAIFGADGATDLLLPTDDGAWTLVGVDDVELRIVKSVDGTRRLGSVTADDVAVGLDRLVDPGPMLRDLLVTLAAAESVGAMAWCTETAATYACEREQFGRPIGQFQAVKHRCAGMLVDLESARAAAWDAARASAAHEDGREVPFAACVAGAVVPDAALRCAKDCVQVLGGIGYTWEHDAHVYLKRALAQHGLLGGRSAWIRRVVGLAADGVRRSLRVDLGPDADPVRDEVRAFVAETKARPSSEWTSAMADAGYLVPYWPAPWGRDAGPVEQLVIDEELGAARLRRPHLQVGAWVLPTIIAHGTAEQQERWVPATLRGELTWCQLFSEPGAGSDLASLTTRAERDDERGGWRITGQKVWTTMAQIAQWGLLLARTDPSAPKHEGITAFVLDMTAPGIDVRPLRELTGVEFFNEVFFDDVFTPDDCVIGEVDRGWDAARTTLANERVSMGSGSSFGPGVESVVNRWAGSSRAGDELMAAEVGQLVVEGDVLAVLGLRSTLKALAGADPGSEASIRKLMSTEHDQRVQEVGLALLGPASAVDDGDAVPWIAGFLGNRALSIAGGTSDVQRNIIAERLLGLPKD